MFTEETQNTKLKAMHFFTFIAALFSITKIWKQPKCPSTDEWMKKNKCIYTMDYDSAIKKNETLPFAMTRMDLEVIVLSEKDKCQVIALIGGIGILKTK